jgi:hypothetical protein
LSVKLVEVAHEQRRWRIGELSKATGLAIRALRFYDDTGVARSGSAVTWVRCSPRCC